MLHNIEKQVITCQSLFIYSKSKIVIIDVKCNMVSIFSHEMHTLIGFSQTYMSTQSD